MAAGVFFFSYPLEPAARHQKTGVCRPLGRVPEQVLVGEGHALAAAMSSSRPRPLRQRSPLPVRR